MPLVVGRLEIEGGLEGRHGDRVIEVTILIEPLHTEVMLTCLLERLVDRSEVFEASLRADKLMGGIVSWVVREAEAQWQPSLLHLRVGVGRHAEV